ncbi:uncharacterized protein DSM5745_02626 [Aspergillus mulundensis]|uniref:Uncharacterized protein n=1 Tax=Aspergillus mulundensis TaxID=1810919 RepID=A0A3D8SXF8_9EURO|nr:Uncharacterized protein DSM5745_02626 [Aspergillus mulundensis]RDW90851.1 Uncharacterized protein DSM5745_02626 [Aspergillus mulundensis]
MFGWSTMGLPAIGSDPDSERSPPPPPTKLDFPVYRVPAVPDTPSEDSLRNLQAELASIRRPQDITPDKFKDLNLKVETDVPLSAIVRHNGAKTAPPLPWELDCPNPSLGSPAPADGTPIFMDNENPYPTKDKYELLEQELLLDNDDAFREVARLPPRAGRERVRVTQTRKFWTALERMSQYWDDSLDKYFERPKSPEPSDTEADTETTEVIEATPMDVDPPTTTTTQDNTKPELVKKYKGRRIAAGPAMPEDVRDETVRALTEMAAWPFGCQASLPMNTPKLSLGTLLFPVRQTFLATRSPKDRQLARNGMLEGPLFVAQCRPETVFRGPHEKHGDGLGDTCDLVREVGAMLLAAQERAREGAIEVRPGEGKWWTTKPRWGGAPNDAIGDSVRIMLEQEQQAAALMGRPRSSSRPQPPALRRPGLRRAMSSSDKWKIISPGPGLWDKRMRYIQIGRDRDCPYDDVRLPPPPPSTNLTGTDLHALLPKPPPLNPPPPHPPPLHRHHHKRPQHRLPNRGLRPRPPLAHPQAAAHALGRLDYLPCFAEGPAPARGWAPA